jgi:hypothetical protein
MIRKTSQGSQVLSSKGKPLSKPNLSPEAAKARLAQVEMFKHMKEQHPLKEKQQKRARVERKAR